MYDAVLVHQNYLKNLWRKDTLGRFPSLLRDTIYKCFSVLLALRLPCLGKRQLILLLFVCLCDLRMFGFVCFLFLLVSGKGCGL